MPPSAREVYYRETGVIDGDIWIRFDAPPADVRRLISRLHFKDIQWSSVPSGAPKENSFPDGLKIKPPYRSASFDSLYSNFVFLDFEEHPRGDWTVWFHCEKD